MLTEAIKEDKKKHTRTVTDIEHTNNIFRTRLFFTSLSFKKKRYESIWTKSQWQNLLV